MQYKSIIAIFTIVMLSAVRGMAQRSASRTSEQLYHVDSLFCAIRSNRFDEAEMIIKTLKFNPFEFVDSRDGNTWFMKLLEMCKNIMMRDITCRELACLSICAHPKCSVIRGYWAIIYCARFHCTKIPRNVVNRSGKTVSDLLRDMADTKLAQYIQDMLAGNDALPSEWDLVMLPYHDFYRIVRASILLGDPVAAGYETYTEAQECPCAGPADAFDADAARP